jgi:methionyl-tRNA formyltransferase
MRLLLFLEESAGIQALRTAHASEHDVVAVLTTLDHQETKRLGASVQGVAEYLDLSVWEAERVKSPKFAEQVRMNSVDLILNVHSLHIVHPEVLAAARVGAFNLHTGPLPAYAGMNAVNWAIMNGESQHGTTLHWMEPGIDTGDIAFEKKFDLSPEATGLSVSRQCTKDGIDLIRQLLTTDPDSIPRRSQDLSQRHYYKLGLPFNGMIPWDRAQSLERYIRACNFYPLPSPWGIPTIEHGGTSIGLMEVAVTDEVCQGEPGRLQMRGQRCLVSTGDFWVELKKLLYGNKLVTPQVVFYEQEPGR